MLPDATLLAVQGYHFEKITSQQISLQDFKEYLAMELEEFKEAVSHPAGDVEAIEEQRQALFTRVRAHYESIPGDFRHDEDGIEPAMETFRSSVNARVEQFTHSAAT